MSGGGCQAAMSATTVCGWLMFMQCGELRYGKKFLLKLKGAVWKTDTTVLTTVSRHVAVLRP